MFDFFVLFFGILSCGLGDFFFFLTINDDK